MTIENHRRDARIDACIPVAVIRGRTSLDRETADVSFRGLFVKTSDPPALRSLVRLRVTLPGRTLDTHAMAVHVVDGGDGREAGVGLQFWGLSGDDRRAWETFIRDLVSARREASKRAAQPSGTHPANTEMNTPSGIRTVYATEAPPSPTRARTK